jgi:hypothetical protein
MKRRGPQIWCVGVSGAEKPDSFSVTEPRPPYTEFDDAWDTYLDWQSDCNANGI